MCCGVAPILCGLLLASCGTLLAPGPFPLQVDSQPSGATVVYEGNEVGVTPCTIPMRRSSRRIEVRLAGYLPQPVDVGVARNPWLACNLVTLGLGMYFDKAVGSTWNPDTRPLAVELAVEGGPPRATWVRVSDDNRGMTWQSRDWRTQRYAGTAGQHGSHERSTGDFLGGLVGVVLECLIRSL
jgi:hypothetical protein